MADGRDTAKASLPFWAEDVDFAQDHQAWEQRRAPPAWRTLQIGGLTLSFPVVARFGKGRKVDKVNPAGAGNEEIFDVGADNGEVLLVGTMWMPRHQVEFEQLVKLLDLDGLSTDRTAVDVHHPALAVLGIASIYPVYLTAPEPADAAGDVMEWSLRALRFAPKKLGKRLAAKPAVGTGLVLHEDIEKAARVPASATSSAPAMMPSHATTPPPSSTEVDP